MSIPIFVYGTLRKGFGLHRMIELSVEAGPFPAKTPGQLFYHPKSMYPVLVKLREAALMNHGHHPHADAVGEFFLMYDGAAITEVIRMEVLAGYNAEWVTGVEAVNEAGEQVCLPDEQVLTFTYTPQPWERLQTLPGNDWAIAEARHEWGM